MERRKIANEAEARRALKAVARTGAGIAAWARAHGVDGRSLHAWDMVLARKATGRASCRPGSATLVELVPTTVVSTARYVLRVGEGSIEFGDDARDETLRRVVGVLRSC